MASANIFSGKNQHLIGNEINVDVTLLVAPSALLYTENIVTLGWRAQQFFHFCVTHTGLKFIVILDT